MDLQTGNIKKHFFQYLFPAVAGAVVVALYSFVDTIAVGQGVGPNGTAAIAVWSRLLPSARRQRFPARKR